MIDDVLSELKAGIEKAKDALRRELGKLRTGRAHPGMLETLRVNYYGQSTPIAQMATVNVPEPRMLTVKPWDKSQVQAVEKAIRESNLGLNPQVDSELIRIPIPALSEERRKELVKVAKHQGEECKVAVRKARHDAVDMLDEIEKDGGAGEDEVARGRKKAEEIVSESGSSIDAIVAQKEKEILAI